MERIETAVGACLTQLVMIAAIITTAGTIWDGNLPALNTIDSIPDFSGAITPHLGYTAGRILFSLGVIGGAMIGAIVVTITASWTLGEVIGFGRDLNKSPREAPGFYIVYMCILVVATTICILLPDYLVDINIFAEVLNAVLVPVVLLFTYLLSKDHLPNEIKLQGVHSIFIAIVFSICSIFSIGATIFSLYQTIISPPSS
jgi:Mn2+/Fe2+ NRAMP family transporter